jgi:hypothetical protein
MRLARMRLARMRLARMRLARMRLARMRLARMRARTPAWLRKDADRPRRCSMRNNYGRSCRPSRKAVERRHRFYGIVVESCPVRE